MSLFDPHNIYIEKIRTHPKANQSLEKVWTSFANQYSVVDLGCGNGHFIEEYLKQNPNYKILGIEKRFKRVFKTAQKIDSVGSESSLVLHKDLNEFLDETPADFWQEIWFQFPDPWPKARHEKNRNINASSFERIYKALRRGGRLCFRSDCRTYWEYLQMLNIRYEYFPIIKSQKGDLFTDHPPTLFQQKFMKLGVPIYSLEFRK